MTETVLNVHVGKYFTRGSISFMDFFKKKDPIFWNLLFSKEPILINLDGFNFIEHEGAIWFAYIIAFRNSRGLLTYVRLPSDDRVLSYLKSIGFSRLGDGINCHFQNFAFFDNNKNYYKYSNDIENNLDKIIYIRGKNLSMNIPTIEANLEAYLFGKPFLDYHSSNFHTLFNELFNTAVVELIKNVIDYGGGDVKGTGIGVCSLIPPLRSANFIRYCFLDIGAGFRYTLSAKDDEEELDKLGEIIDDKDAIIKGLLFRKAIFKENIIGLYPVLGIICATKGKIGIRSGSAIVELSFSNDLLNENFKSQFKIREKKHIDEYVSIIKPLLTISHCNIIPGSQIYIDLGFSSIDRKFLQVIFTDLENRGFN